MNDAMFEVPYFLSIGIPTWNRCRYLQANIEHLIRQIEKYQLKNVEIFISDNASDDDTQRLCQSFADHYSYVNYYRQEHNKGANANFENVLRHATGQYIWLLGDDDLLAEDVLTRVMADIQLAKPDVIAGPAIHSDTLQKATHHAIQVNMITDQTFFTQGSLIETAGKISGLIFKKASVMPLLQASHAVIVETKTPWPHLVWLIALLNDPAKKMLLLHYGINQLVSENWHNLILNGTTLIDIHFVAQQQLISAMRTSISDAFYHILMNQTVALRKGILIKCVVYATYLDSYRHALGFACEVYPKMIGRKNKAYFLVFLMLPLMLPVFIRKIILKSVASLPLSSSQKFKKILSRLEHSKKLLQTSNEVMRQSFNKEQL